MPLDEIAYIDRVTGNRCREKVFGDEMVRLLYGNGFMNRWVGRPLQHAASKWPLFSKLAGWFHRQPFTRGHIQRFIQTYQVDPSEFEQPVDSFSSFADFFIRKLKPECRPIAPGHNVAIAPADARYYFFDDVAAIGPFDIKGQTFDLAGLLQDRRLAQRYAHASLVLARLCPSDYHRFHFPIACTPSESRLINGYLYSVNPLAIRQNVRILSENKRRLTVLEKSPFGSVLFIEIGATTVGTIHETYKPHEAVEKGAEKGFFAFGGSALAILFPENSIRFDADLLAATRQKIEIRCLMGQPIGQRP